MLKFYRILAILAILLALSDPVFAKSGGGSSKNSKEDEDGDDDTEPTV